MRTEGPEQHDLIEGDARRGLDGPRRRSCVDGRGAGGLRVLRSREQRARGCGLRVGKMVDRVYGRLNTEHADEEREREDGRRPAPSRSRREAQASHGQEQGTHRSRGRPMVRVAGDLVGMRRRHGCGDEQQPEEQHACAARPGHPGLTPPDPSSFLCIHGGRGLTLTPYPSKLSSSRPGIGGSRAAPCTGSKRKQCATM